MTMPKRKCQESLLINMYIERLVAWTETGDCGKQMKNLREQKNRNCSSRAPSEKCQYRDYVGNGFLRFQMDGITWPLESVEGMPGDNFS